MSKNGVRRANWLDFSAASERSQPDGEIRSDQSEQSKELLNLARDGDGKALGELLEIYRPLFRPF